MTNAVTVNPFAALLGASSIVPDSAQLPIQSVELHDSSSLEAGDKGLLFAELYQQVISDTLDSTLSIDARPTQPIMAAQTGLLSSLVESVTPPTNLVEMPVHFSSLTQVDQATLGQQLPIDGTVLPLMVEGSAETAVQMYTGVLQGPQNNLQLAAQAAALLPGTGQTSQPNLQPNLPNQSHLRSPVNAVVQLSESDGASQQVAPSSQALPNAAPLNTDPLALGDRQPLDHKGQAFWSQVTPGGFNLKNLADKITPEAKPLDGMLAERTAITSDRSNPLIDAQRANLTAIPTDRTSATGQPVTSLPVPHLAGSPNWDQALGQRILWLASKGLGQAELRLDPPQLGTVSVRISMQDDQASLMFQAAHPGAREALETALPKLREMFAEQGLQLGDADVGGQEDSKGSDTDLEQSQFSDGKLPSEQSEAGPSRDELLDESLESQLGADSADISIESHHIINEVV